MRKVRRTNMTPQNISADIAVIKQQLIELNKKMDSYIVKVDCNEKDIVELKTKLINFNSFQTFLTFVGTTIATALAWLINNQK